MEAVEAILATRLAVVEAQQDILGMAALPVVMTLMVLLAVAVVVVVGGMEGSFLQIPAMGTSISMVGLVALVVGLAFWARGPAVLVEQKELQQAQAQ